MASIDTSFWRTKEQIEEGIEMCNKYLEKVGISLLEFCNKKNGRDNRIVIQVKVMSSGASSKM
jgi:hypothetical protein